MYLNNIRYAMEKDDESEEWYSCQSWILEISRKCQKMLLGKDWKGNHSNRICRLFWRASRQTEKLEAGKEQFKRTDNFYKPNKSNEIHIQAI